MYKLPGKQILSLGTFKDLVELSKLKFFWVLRDKLADAHASPELESRLVFPSIFPHKGKNLESRDFPDLQIHGSSLSQTP